ncbi:hypothetical protein CEUSTIGMA_g10657.t1 [Chlamydomonas eustigma]|uniref:NADH dehydrogenase [ubiquinone] 1 alpha subcomplex assembly factor 3 n=1 Tax=Chlamydomonas eustigma TaxID=1157962 RepID=A0A250XJG5_9CHLO|nr:hypothetical protein CEUSTIGMA_g10657.t1 [Chlamydomonas eustigma]|eukprot:GAX83231.1 hypothetical protein CEUSTIGMA_g10657.t1 [Chlamydomonas eustigma]
MCTLIKAFTWTILQKGMGNTQKAQDLLLRNYGGISRIAEAEKGNTKFSGYYAGGFYINNVQVPGSVLASADLYLMWRPRTMSEVTPDSLSFLDIIKPVPEVLVLGCGMKPEPVPKDVADFLAQRNIKVEVLDSRNATGYFNVLNEEGRVVVGALLAADPNANMPETMPAFKEPTWERGFALGNKSPF